MRGNIEFQVPTPFKRNLNGALCAYYLVRLALGILYALGFGFHILAPISSSWAFNVKFEFHFRVRGRTKVNPGRLAIGFGYVLPFIRLLDPIPFYPSPFIGYG